MCYGRYAVVNPMGGVEWVEKADFHRLYQDGLIVPREDGWAFAKDTVGAIVFRDGSYKSLPMRWDLIPRGFLADQPQLTVAEAIKKKNSRARNPDTMKPWGFDSYNARVETVAKRWAFRSPWKEGLRAVMPARGFRERPNMDGAPPEFKGREYEIRLDGEYFMGCIWDTWRRGEASLDSLSVVTVDSEGNGALRGIWHERCPLLLTAEQAEAWLDPKTPPEKALGLCKLVSADVMDVKERVKASKT